MSKVLYAEGYLNNKEIVGLVTTGPEQMFNRFAAMDRFSSTYDYLGQVFFSTIGKTGARQIGVQETIL